METWLYLALRDTWGKNPALHGVKLLLHETGCCSLSTSQHFQYIVFGKPKNTNRARPDTLTQETIVLSFRSGMKQRHVCNCILSIMPVLFPMQVPYLYRSASMHSSRPPSLSHLRPPEHSDCNGKGSPSVGPTHVSLEDNTEDENVEEEANLVSLCACVSICTCRRLL